MPPRGTFNTKSPTIKRILREASELSSSPSPDYTATPLDDNLFEWHFTLRGPPGNSDNPEASPSGSYSEGIYHGRIVLPPTYPLRPPSFRFLTPSGRFETNREICLSISGHHEETWQPAWGLRTALVAWVTNVYGNGCKGQLGGLECSDAMRRRMAKESQAWKCSSCGKSNGAILSECVEAAKALEPAPEEVVPAELTMAWKDEMGATKKADSDDGESAELAEGFVQTAPVIQVPPQAPAAPTYPAARPAQSVPRPTAVVSVPAQHTPQTAQIRRNTNDGIPVWLDKAILGVSACLLVMILRVLFGL